MSGSRLVGFLVVASSAAMLVVACSSVPEIEFVDADATAVASDSGATSSGTVKTDGSAGVDASADQSAPAVYCTNGGKANPPPGGICCGALACIGCTDADCADCDGRCKVTGPACCKKGQVRCAAVDLCK